MPNLQGYFNQTYTVEFDVPGALDGVTLSPAISATVPAAQDPQSMYRPEVVTGDNPDGNLGLIDCDYLVSEDGPDKVGTRGNRYVAWIWIEATSPGAAGAALEVVDAVDGTVTVQKVIADLAGETTFYKDTGILVPQGSLLRISGFTGGAKVRLHIAGLTDRGLIEVQQAICCFQKGVLPTGPAFGDLGAPGGAPTPASPNYPNPAVVGIQGRRVDPAAPALNQGLVWNGAAWAPAPIAVSQCYWGTANTGIAAGTRFLPPGFDLSGGPLPSTEIPLKATQNGLLRFLHIQQTPGTGPGATITYRVYIGGAPTALFVTLPVTGTDANNVAAILPISSNNNMSLGITLSAGVLTAPTNVTANYQMVTTG